MQQKTPLSVVIITLNAASQIEACLKSAAFADEIVVVDSGSRDGTREIALKYNARVLHQDWLGFGRQKQFAVEQASHDWVLCLDADERAPPELAASLVRALDAPVAPVYRIARRNRFLGRGRSGRAPAALEARQSFLAHSRDLSDLDLSFSRRLSKRLEAFSEVRKG